MQDSTYQLIAMGARYVFLALGALIAWRAALCLLREHARRKHRLRALPDAGMVGELRDEESDRAYPLPREGVIGSGMGADIRLKGLKRQHVNFSFVDGRGLLLTPCRARSEVLLNGDPIRRGGYALHGAHMRLGGYTLKVRLFAGLNVPRPAAYQAEETWRPAYGEELYAPDGTAYFATHGAPPPYAQAGRYQPAFEQTGAFPVVSAPDADTADAAAPPPFPVRAQEEGEEAPYAPRPDIAPPQYTPPPEYAYPPDGTSQPEYAYPPDGAQPPQYAPAPDIAQDMPDTPDAAPRPFEKGAYAPPGADDPAPFQAPRRRRSGRHT